MSVEALRKQQDLDHAADLGGRAYQNGVQWHENPYPVDTDEHKAWIDGWQLERDYWRSI